MLAHRPYRAFTLIELIIVIAIVAVVASAIFIAVDPAKRIGEAKDAQRWQDITAIAQAVEQYTADYGALPSDFASSSINTGEKVVLCDTVTTLTCDGQSRSCLIVDDTDFLGVYLPQIPYDPDKSSDSDTGYYITRGSGDIMSFGVCDAYASVGIAMNSKIALPDYVDPTPCGGYESGGYCWYYGGLGQSCNTACATHGGCVAANWNDDASCTIGKYLTAGPMQCGVCSSAAVTAAPYTRETSYVTCYYRAGGTSQNCATTVYFADEQRICACES